MFTFALLGPADFALLASWLGRPHVAEWWGDAEDAEELARDYLPDIAAGRVKPYFACIDGEPRGFIQVYDVMNADPEWWKDETDPGARGIDQFLANESDLGKGLGTQLVREFLAFVFSDPTVTKVQTDPSPNNARAIRAYEKAGFAKSGIVETPDGPALLMIAQRPR